MTAKGETAKMAAWKTNNGVTYVTSPLLEALGVPHAFAARYGGVSSGAFDSLNVSTRRADENGNCDLYENTVENFRRALFLVGASCETAVCAHQVHGNRILSLDGSFAGMGIRKGSPKNEDADGLFLSADCRGVCAVGVKSADCTPILLADKKTGDVCAVHAGWRGTCAGIVREAVKTFLARGSRAEDLVAAVGPCIGVCCYEVGADVYEAAKALFIRLGASAETDRFFTDRTEKADGVRYHFDMAGMNVRLAVLSGVPVTQAENLSVCTCCTTDETGAFPFFSHRRQRGHSGTQLSVIAPVHKNH